MKKSINTSYELHFIWDYLNLLFYSFDKIIERDDILNNALQTAFQRVGEILFTNSFGDIAEQYIVTVYDDDKD